MKVNSVIPDVIVDDVNVHVSMYREKGFSLIDQYPRWGSLRWAYLEDPRRGMKLMLEKRSAVMDEIAALLDRDAGPGLIYYAEVDDIDGVYGRLKDKMKLVTDIYATSYGMDEFVAQDARGAVIVFGERNTGPEWECE